MCHFLHVTSSIAVLMYMYNQEYEKITKVKGCHPDMWTYLGCCYFMLGMYQEADSAAQKGRWWWCAAVTVASSILYSNMVCCMAWLVPQSAELCWSCISCSLSACLCSLPVNMIFRSYQHHSWVHWVLIGDVVSDRRSSDKTGLRPKKSVLVLVLHAVVLVLVLVLYIVVLVL